MNNELEQLKRLVNDLTQQVHTLKTNYEKHQHDSIDGTNTLSKKIKLLKDQFLYLGDSTQGTLPNLNLGLSNEQYQYSISVGKDGSNEGLSNKANLLQFNLISRSNSKDCSISSTGGILVSSFANTYISTTAGGNTVTISGYNFITDELSNSLINIFNSSGTLIETRTILSNTSTVITINGTWGASTSGGTFFIYSPVYLGTNFNIFQRLFIQESTDGGIRFGAGVTAGGQNGLLYMDSVGDLYWRNKSGTSVKLN